MPSWGGMAREALKVIVNPTAAHGAVGREWPELRSYIGSQGVAFSEALTEAPGHATQLAQEAAREGYKTVVAVGGDGTINEVVNGLLNGAEVQAGTSLPVSLGVISRGSGSDLARTLGLRRTRDAISALSQRDRTLLIDVGELVLDPDGARRRRLFVNVAGLGFDGEVVEGLLRQENGGKPVRGALPYLAQVVRSIMHYDNKRIRAEIDGEVIEGVYTALFAANGRYFGGGMKVAPGADISDGLFDVVTIGAVSRPGLLARVPTVYVGWHVHLRPIRVRRARQLRVDTDERLLVQADGELVGQAPVAMRVIPGALRVRV